MVEPADLRLFEFQPPQLLGIGDGDPPDVGDGLLAAFDAEFLELLEGFLGRANGLVDAAMHAVSAGERAGLAGCVRGGCRRGVDGQLGDDLADYLSDVGRGGGHEGVGSEDVTG